MQIPLFHKTRIAPTPSGFLHLGNAFSFLLTARLAKENGADMLLRIDDMDAQRVRKEYVEDIFETLKFLEINYTEGPQSFGAYDLQFSQRHRQPLYDKALKELASQRAVFACNCSRMQLSKNVCRCEEKKLPLSASGTAWRLKTDATKSVKVHTYKNGVLEKHVPANMKDFVVRKKDGMPSYQLTSLIDDVHFKIDFIVRGEDLWESTLAQLYLAETLNLQNFRDVVFHHHALIKDLYGHKLSKSAGALSIKGLRAAGKGKAEILEMLGGMNEDFF